MRKTIKADKKRKILKEEFLNDNALLELTMEDNRDVTVGVRYVESPIQGIKEQFITRMSIYDYMSEYDNLVKISTDNSTIATFKKIEEGYQLDRIYDVKEHQMAIDEFKDIVYAQKFPNLALDKHLVLRSTK